MYYFSKMVTEKSLVKWSYLLFLESAKLEFHCICYILVLLEIGESKSGQSRVGQMPLAVGAVSNPFRSFPHGQPVPFDIAMCSKGIRLLNDRTQLLPR